MRRMLVLLMLLIIEKGFAQRDSVIVPYSITVSYDHTVNLIFPYAIKSVDRGSSAVIVQPAKGVENILQAKAAEKEFRSTNLSVVTADGRFYSFVVRYADVPDRFNISFSGSDAMVLKDGVTNEAALERASWRVAGMPSFMRVHKEKEALRFTLQGVYLSEEQLWLRLQLDNHSQVDFKPQYIRFFLRDKKRAKRTALRETELMPVFQRAPGVTVGLTSSLYIIGFTPFTVPKHQRLIIQLSDASGGRVLQLSLKNNCFLKARKMPL